MSIKVIGIDPSMNNTGVAFIRDHRHHFGDLPLITTFHIKELQAGKYSEIIRFLADPKKKCELLTGDNCGSNSPCGVNFMNEVVTAGFIENFDDVGGGETTKATIRSLSRAGGQAESELVMMGIPMIPIKINEWRKWALGQAPKHPQRSGTLRRYWSKGKGNIPSNVAPALLNLFRHSLLLEKNCKPIELFHKKKEAPDDIHLWEFVDCVTFVAKKIPKLSSTRIRLAFGKSLDELEAAAIALAGYRLIKAGQIDGL